MAFRKGKIYQIQEMEEVPDDDWGCGCVIFVILIIAFMSFCGGSIF